MSSGAQRTMNVPIVTLKAQPGPQLTLAFLYALDVLVKSMVYVSHYKDSIASSDPISLESGQLNLIPGRRSTLKSLQPLETSLLMTILSIECQLG